MSRDNIAKALTASMEKGRLIERFYAERYEEDDEFAQFLRGLVPIGVYRLRDYRGTSWLKEPWRFFSCEISCFFFCNREKESFVYDLSNSWFKHGRILYQLEKTEKPRCCKRIQGKVDSLELAIDATLRRLGEYQDQNNL